MLDVKKTLSKILNWSGLKYTWDFTTLNTYDTWIPVLIGNTIQHRVLPSDADVNATKVGSLWTAGAITAFRRGNCCVLKINGATISAPSTRTTIATLPSGFFPPTECTKPEGSGMFGIRANGEIWADGTYGGVHYWNLTYPV